MKLSFDQIREIAFGAVKTERQGEEIRFRKCTDGQIAAYRSVNEFIWNNSQGSTGVRLDFHTDARSLLLSVTGGGKYEVYVNGLPAAQFTAAGEETFETALPGGDVNRVTVYLPSHGAGGVIRGVELTDAAVLRPHVFDRKFLFLGDSITQGWNAAFDSLSFANRTAGFFNADCVNQGIGGSRFLPDTVVELPFDPDDVFIAFGTNDFDFYKKREDPLGDFLATACEYFARVKALWGKKNVFVISPIARKLPEEEAALFRRFCTSLTEKAAEAGFVAIDGFTLHPLCLPLYADGGLHPNDLGFSVYAENLIRKILPYIK